MMDGGEAPSVLIDGMLEDFSSRDEAVERISTEREWNDRALWICSIRDDNACISFDTNMELIGYCQEKSIEIDDEITGYIY